MNFLYLVDKHFKMMRDPFVERFDFYLFLTRGTEQTEGLRLL